MKLKLKEVFNKENRRKVVKATVLTAVTVTAIGVPVMTYLYIKEHKKRKMLEEELIKDVDSQPPQGSEFEF